LLHDILVSADNHPYGGSITDDGEAAMTDTDHGETPKRCPDDSQAPACGADGEPPTCDTDDDRWGILAIAGLSGFCCVGILTITAGAAVTGGAAAGVTATASGGVQSVGGFLVTALATALPLTVAGLWFRRRAR
jgi:hypothetical protein